MASDERHERRKIKWILAQAAQKGNLMKKYRITKITVRTREIVSTAKSSTDENSFSVCPVCNTTLGKSNSTAEKNVEENHISKTRLKN